MYYLTSNQIEYIYKFREVPIEDYKMDHMNSKGYELEEMNRGRKRRENKGGLNR